MVKLIKTIGAAVERRYTEEISYKRMRYEPIDVQLFIQNRQRLYKLLKPKSLVILNANDPMPTNADGTMGFKQNSDLFYLSGIDQEETLLVLFPDHPDPKFRELLFCAKQMSLLPCGKVKN